jgi:hypothetical protein
MNQRSLTLLAASIGAISFLAGAPLLAAPQPNTIVSVPVAATPQSNAGIVAQLEARRAQRGMDARHGFAVLALHPGMQGTQVARVAHTWKGVPIFGSESVVVLDRAEPSSPSRHRSAAPASARVRERARPPPTVRAPERRPATSASSR